MAREPSRVLEEVAALVRVCTRCPLHEARTFAVPGEGPAHAPILLVGEAPGRKEDEAGRPFVGPAGRVLERALGAARLRREDVFVTNVVKCRPPANRAPKLSEIATCRPYLMTQIEAIHPTVIVALGSTSLRSLTGSGATLSKVRGRCLRFGEMTLLVTYHPAAVLYNRNLERALIADLRNAARWALRPRVRSGPPRPGHPTRPAVSSGAAVMNREGRLLLLHQADERRWCLPKGAQEVGESLEGAARREVREETGFEVDLGRRLATVRYAYYWPPDRTNIEKRVVYFLAWLKGGRLRLEPAFDRHRWAGEDEAIGLLRWPNDRRVARSAFAALRSSRPRRRRSGRGRGATR